MHIRRVCKLWNSLINGEFKFKRLRFYQSYQPYYHYDLESYDFIFESILDYPRNDPKFSRILYLYANLDLKDSELKYALDLINSFKFLEEISLFCNLLGHNAVEGVQNQFVVNLPRLKKANFRFGAIGEANSSVLLDLPSLLCISIGSLAGITIGHPEKLRTLVTRSLFDGRLDYSKFTSLTDIFIDSDDLPSISASFLERLPSLREVHMSSGSFLPLDYRLPEPSLGKTNPKIFYFEFEVSVREIESEGAQWPEYVGLPNSAQFITRKLHRSVDNHPYIGLIDYNTMAGELNDFEMFDVIPKKFPSINHVHINGTVVDENRLLKFSSKFNISVVTLERTSLPQRFFEQLSENHPFISSLHITEPTMSILSGDFDFVFKFKNLSLLYFRDCPLSLNFVARAMKELKSLFSLFCINIDEREDYGFSLYTSFSENVSVLSIFVPGLPILDYDVPAEEAPSLMNAMQRQLNADGPVCLRELHTLVHHLELEKENALFWMHKYLYDQRHSIYLILPDLP